MTRQLALDSPLGRRVLAAQGKIESGQLANMKTYRLPREARIHTRILGEDRTLCGRSLQHNGQWAWQFIHRGAVMDALPSGAYGDRDSCAACSKNVIVRITADVSALKRASVTEEAR